MPTKINADSVTGGAVVTADASGVLELQSAGTTALTLTGANVAAAGNVTAAGNLSVTGNVSVTGTLNSTTGLTSPALIAGGASGAQIRLGEATANGTNYAAIKAPDNLASNLTLTLPTADGTSGQFLQTNGSGQLAFATPSSGTQQFTSSGSITAGQAVSINTDGTVSATTGIDQAAAFVGSSVLSSSNRYTTAGIYDAASGFHIHIIVTSGADRYAYSFKVSSTGALTNTNLLYIGAGSSADRKVSIVKDTTSGRFGVMFSPGSATSAELRYISLNTSTGAMSNNGSVNFGSNAYNGAFNFDMYFDSFANRMVCIYNYTNGGLYANAVNFNSGSPTVTANQTFSSYNNSECACAAAFNTSNNTGYVYYSDPSSGQLAARAITLNAAGNSMTIGAETVTGATYRLCARAFYFPSINRIAVSSTFSGGGMTTFLMAGTGNVAISGSAPSNATSDWGTYGFFTSADTTNNVLYASGARTNILYVWSYTVTASAITYVPGVSYNAPGTVNYDNINGITYDPTNLRSALLTYNATNANTTVVGYIPAVFSTTADKFVGFATQSVSTGQPVTVTTLGGVNTNQSGLTAGTNYYLQVNGAISTTPSRFGIVAEGLSATSALVTTGGAFKRLISQTVISGSPGAVTITLPSGYSQFEITFQNICGGTTGAPGILSTTSGGSNNSWYGRGYVVYAATSSNYEQGGTTFTLSGGQTHASGTSFPFGGSLLLQASSSATTWNYTLMTNFYNSTSSYFSSTGYVNSVPATLTFTGLGTLSNNGVITLYGVG